METGTMDVLTGRYELRRLLGRGGMAEVWAASDIDTGMDVAVKSVNGAPDSLAAQRLRREASVTASITHPGVVGVRGVGDERDRTFMVMDLLPGDDLARVLAAGPLPLPRALEVTAGVAEALRAVHRTGVVHGDVKPANVMVADEHSTLIDFGIASDSSGWGEGTSYGTTASMAPEQVTGEPVTPAADMYGLGGTIFAAISARTVFPLQSPSEVMQHHARATPPRLSDLVIGVPPRLDALVAALLAKNPADRPGAAEVAETLTALLSAPAVRLQSAPLTATPVPPQPHLDPAGTQPMLAVGAERLNDAA